MKSVLGILIALMLLTFSCKPISGYLKVLDSFKVLVEETEGCDNPLGGAGTDLCDEDEEPVTVIREKTINPGEFKAYFSFKSKKRAKLTVKIKKNTKIEIPLKIPAGAELPNYNGSFSLLSEQSGQPIDIHGDIVTTESTSGSFTGTDSCTYQDWEMVCHTVGNPPTPVCSHQSVTKYGRQYVEYYYQYTNTHLELTVQAPGSNYVLADYDGTRNAEDKIVTYRGECR